MNCEVCQLKELVQCGEHELEKKIDEKIEQFISWVEKHPNKKVRSVILSVVAICLSNHWICN